jgi:predicted nucleotidyltransferase component of viral defense system
MKYRTATAFRIALEQRLLTHSRTTGLGLNRLRKLVAFERLLARLLVEAPDRWMLKGGLALDFRLGDRARTTVDMDLACQDDESAANADFRAVEGVDLSDHFSFEIARTALLDAADVAGAVRYRVRVSVAGRRFEELVVDVGFADAPVAMPDEVDSPGLLAFADLPIVRVPTLPLPVHVAEKVHAYTRRYGALQHPSTRVKDLVDLVLLSVTSSFQAGALRSALRQTFDRRATHPLPAALPEPPPEWDMPYRRLAKDLAIPSSAAEAHRLSAAFLEPVLARDIDDQARWPAGSGGWSSPDGSGPSLTLR